MAGDMSDGSSGLDTDLAELYAGPLESFVARRNALAGELRAAGRKEQAASVKRLRKPRRLAWALNIASLGEPELVEAIEQVVASTVAAQSGRGKLRDRLSELRRAIDGFATAAARLASEAGQSFEPAEIAVGVMAVIGTRDAFEQLRASRLVDIPDAGGLDLLTAPSGLADSTGPDPDAALGAPDAPDPVALENLQRAEDALAAARETLVAAEQDLIDAETAAADAERKLRLAQREADSRRAELERVRADAERAVEQAARAEAAFAEARRAVDDG